MSTYDPAMPFTFANAVLSQWQYGGGSALYGELCEAYGPDEADKLLIAVAEYRYGIKGSAEERISWIKEHWEKNHG